MAEPARRADPLTAALERGRRAKADMLAAEGGWLTGEVAAARLGISPETLAERARQNRVLAVSVARGVVGYPAWQFADGSTLPHLEEVLDLLREHSPWSKMIFFLNRDVYAEGQTPLSLLRRGQLDLVRRAACMYGEHGAA
jgi:hypothetical protein